jgi:hypothetical protein
VPLDFSGYFHAYRHCIGPTVEKSISQLIRQRRFFFFGIGRKSSRNFHCGTSSERAVHCGVGHVAVSHAGDDDFSFNMLAPPVAVDGDGDGLKHRGYACNDGFDLVRSYLTLSTMTV